MRKSGDCVIDCAKALLGNLAESALWQGVVLAQGAPWTTLGIGFVGAFLGISRLFGGKGGGQDDQKILATLRALRRGDKQAEKELEALAGQVSFNFQEVHRRFTRLETLMESVAAANSRGDAGLDDLLGQQFNKGDKDYAEFGQFVVEHFPEFKMVVHGLPESVQELKNELDAVKYTLDSVLFDTFLIRADTQAIRNDTAYIRTGMDQLRRHGRPHTSIPTNLPDPSPRFDAREADLELLHQSLQTCGTLALGQQVALWADGGVGKTMLAEHYGWLYLNEYPGGVFKIGADVAQLRIPLADLAPMLHVAVNHPNTSTPRSPDEVAADVKEALEGNGPALLILDNVPEDQRWFDEAYHQFLPGGHCKRIITTRRDALGEVEMQKVGTFTPAQGRAILARFRKDAGEETNRKDVEWVVDWFGGLGAGLLVVGTYMSLPERNTLTWSAYRKSLEKSGQDAALKADQRSVEKGNIRDRYQHRFDAAFDTTLSAMEKAEPETIALLEYAALLPEDMAPRPWLEELLTRDPRGNVKVLPGHEENPSEPVFARLLAREWLRPVGTEAHILALHRVLRRRLREKIDQRPSDRQTMLETIANHAAWRGSWLAEPGPDHTAPWIDAAHRWELAPLRALVDPPRILDFDHPDVSLCINETANVLYALGRAGDAEPLYRAALAMLDQLFKGDHPHVATSFNNLALVLNALGRSQEAEPLYRDALAMRQRLFKGDHPDVAQSLNNLAVVLRSLGRAKEVESLYRDALAMRQRLFKGDHPDVANSLNNLAGVLDTLSRAKDAEPLYRDALAMRQRLFQGDHPDLASSLNNLAGFLFEQGKREAALPLIDQAAAMILRLFGPDHPTSRTILSWQKTIHGG